MLDLATLTWPCMVCHAERPDALIHVARRPIRGLEHLFPDARWNVRYCADRLPCVEYARAPGPWGGPPSPRPGRA